MSAPPAAARAAAARHNGDRVSRAEIAWAIPAGSRRARSQAAYLAAIARWPELAEQRADRRRNLLEVARILARHASWADRTTRPTRALVCRAAGIGLSTWKACRAQWEAWGFLGTVRGGRTHIARPAALDDGRNDAAVYVLTVPAEKRKSAPPRPELGAETRPPTRSRSDLCTDHTREARTATPETRTGLRPDSLATPAVPDRLRIGAVLEKLSDRARRAFWRDFAAAGWTPGDFVFAIDHERGGQPHRRDWRDVLYPAGWVRYRLSLWRDPSGAPVPSRSQQWAAAAAAAARRQAQLRGQLDAQAAAAAPPSAEFRQALAELRGTPAAAAVTAAQPPSMIEAAAAVRTHAMADAWVARACVLLGHAFMHIRDSSAQPDTRGFPDYLIVGPRRVIYRELKMPGDTLHTEQRRWQWKLRNAGADWDLWTVGQLRRGQVWIELAELVDY